MIRKAWGLCCYTPLGRIQDFLVISFREQWWFLWKDLTGISQLWLSSSPNFHIHPLQNKISIVFALSKFVWHEMVSTSIPISSCLFWGSPNVLNQWSYGCGFGRKLSQRTKFSELHEKNFTNWWGKFFQSWVWEQVSGERDSTPYIHEYVMVFVKLINGSSLLILCILNLLQQFLFLLVLLLVLLDRFCCCCAWVAILHLWRKQTSQPWAVH